MIADVGCSIETIAFRKLCEKGYACNADPSGDGCCTFIEALKTEFQSQGADLNTFFLRSRKC